MAAARPAGAWEPAMTALERVWPHLPVSAATHRRALRLYTASAVTNARADREVGDYNYYGRGGLAASPSAAAESYMTACRNGMAHGCFDVAWLYEFGEGVAQDLHLAKRYYGMAVDAATAIAQDTNPMAALAMQTRVEYRIAWRRWRRRFLYPVARWLGATSWLPACDGPGADPEECGSPKAASVVAGSATASTPAARPAPAPAPAGTPTAANAATTAAPAAASKRAEALEGARKAWEARMAGEGAQATFAAVGRWARTWAYMLWNEPYSFTLRLTNAVRAVAGLPPTTAPPAQVFHGVLFVLAVALGILAGCHHYRRRARFLRAGLQVPPVR